jgi:hypothetical protein
LPAWVAVERIVLVLGGVLVGVLDRDLVAAGIVGEGGDVAERVGQPGVMWPF